MVAWRSGPVPQSQVLMRMNRNVFDGPYAYFPYDSTNANVITITGYLVNRGSNTVARWVQLYRPRTSPASRPRPCYHFQSHSASPWPGSEVAPTHSNQNDPPPPPLPHIATSVFIVILLYAIFILSITIISSPILILNPNVNLRSQVETGNRTETCSGGRTGTRTGTGKRDDLMFVR